MAKINYIKPVNQYREWITFKKLSDGTRHSAFNWSTFSFISIETEFDRVTQDGHLQIIILGLGVFIHWLGKEWSKNGKV